MPIAEAGATKLSYGRSGSGEPLLMIMGMSGTALHWGEPFLQPLRGEFETIVFDNRGVGESSPVSDPFTIRDLAADAAGLLDALELDSVHLLGISMGGMIAQELAFAHPQRIRSLTLGCTYSGGEGSALAPPEVIQRLSESMMSGDRERALRTAWEVNVSPGFAEDDLAYERFLGIAAERAVAVPVVMAQMQACVAHHAFDRLPRLQMPTLVIHGSADQMLPVENGRMIAAAIPRARLEIFDGVGHLFFWEEPERSAALVTQHAAAVHA